MTLARVQVPGQPLLLGPLLGPGRRPITQPAHYLAGMPQLDRALRDLGPQLTVSTPPLVVLVPGRLPLTPRTPTPTSSTHAGDGMSLPPGKSRTRALLLGSTPQLTHSMRYC